MAQKNKVKFGLNKVHYAKITAWSEDGVPTFATPFRRDIYADFSALQKNVSENNAENSGLDIESLEVFENVAYIMAKHADSAIPDNPDDWLMQFNTFSIYEILPQLLDLWGLNVETQVEAKKNIDRLTGK